MGNLVYDLTGEFSEKGTIVDSYIKDDDEITLVYIIEFENNDGKKECCKREPYQISYL